MDVDLKILALCASFVIAFSWGIIFVFMTKKDNSVKFISGIINLSIAIILLNIFLIHSGAKNQALLDIMIYAFSLCLYPLSYLYVKNIANTFKKNFKLFFHFLPAIILTTIYAIALFFLSPQEQKSIFVNIKDWTTPVDKNQLAVYYINLLIRFTIIVQIVLYFIKGSTHLKKFIDAMKNYFSNLESKIFPALYFYYSTYIFLSLVAIIIFGMGYESIYQLSTLHTFLFFMLTVFLFLFNIINYDQRLTSMDDEMYDKDIFEQHHKELKQQQLIDYLEKNKPYLNKDLKLADLTKSLHTNRTYLSNLFNKQFNANFCTVINQYRVEEAKRILANKDYSDFTLSYIAKKCGFGSYRIFVSAFKKETGMLPKDYLKKQDG